MKNITNIYVTLHENGLSNERVIGFLENFVYAMKRVVKKNYNVLIKGRNFSDTDFTSSINKSDLFVFILDNDFESAVNFQSEVKHICDELKLGEQEMQYQKVFKVCLDSFPVEFLPEDLQNYINYNFYEVNVRKKAGIPYDFENDKIKYWGKLLDLVYDINESKLFLSENVSNTITDFIYLAGCSPDLTNSRDDIKRELQHLGFRVLPLTEMPADKDLTIAEITKYLEKCTYFIQLIGQHYGTVQKGEKISPQEQESLLLRESLLHDPTKKRMIWIPVNQKYQDQRQELFVNRIKRDDSSPNCEIIESTLNEFKNTILLRLENKTDNNGFKNQNKTQLYLISKPGTISAHIENVIKEQDLDVLTLNDTNLINVQSHLASLVQSDGIIINYPENDYNWLISKIKDIIKSIGQGRKESYKGICLISDLQPDIDNYLKWLPELVICGKNDMDGLTRFIQKIKGFQVYGEQI